MMRIVGHCVERTSLPVPSVFFQHCSIWDRQFVFFSLRSPFPYLFGFDVLSASKKPATKCFESFFTTDKPTVLPFFPFFSLLATWETRTVRPEENGGQYSIFSLSNFTCLSFSGLLCQRVGKRLHEYFCNTNSMRHTVRWLCFSHYGYCSSKWTEVGLI